MYRNFIIENQINVDHHHFKIQSKLLTRQASGRVPASLGVRLFCASLMMVIFGWLAEIDIQDKVSGFLCGCACWLYIVYETFSGEASEI